MAAKYIYFAGSIRAGRQDANLYSRVVKILKKYGTVLTEHVGDPNLTEAGDTISDKQIHERDIDWLIKSHILVAEVTQVSLGVGYEIGRAVAMNKTILCLYRPTQSDKKLSAMIRGAENGDNIKVIDYCEDQLESILQDYFEHSNPRNM